MPAWRLNPVRPVDQASVWGQAIAGCGHRNMAAIRSYAIAARGYSQDQVIVLHEFALACAVQAINLFGVCALNRCWQAINVIHRTHLYHAIGQNFNFEIRIKAIRR